MEEEGNPPKSVWAVLVEAWTNFNRNDGSAMASHVALSGILALFPFLIFATAATAFLDLASFRETMLYLVFEYWPESLHEAISREVTAILTEQNGGLLTFSALLALYFASNGVSAIRTALNRSYGGPDDRSIIFLRLQSIGFVFLAVLVFVVAAVSLVLLPLGWRLASQWYPGLIKWSETVWFWRSVISIAVIFVGLAVTHRYLPARRKRFRSLLPGILFTLVFWTAGSIAFGAYLEQFADYVSTYAGLATAMIGLVFLYLLGAIFIFGAEINHALHPNSKN